MKAEYVLIDSGSFVCVNVSERPIQCMFVSEMIMLHLSQFTSVLNLYYSDFYAPLICLRRIVCRFD